MKVTLEKLPASQVSFEIEVEGDRSQAIYDRTVQKLMRTMEVPGFRKGKAPKQLVLRQIGAARIKAGVLEELLEETLKQVASDRQDLQVIGNFELATDLDDLLTQFDPGKPFSFRVAVDVQPEVTLKKHKGFTVPVEKVEPDLGQVDKTLLEYQVKKATLVPIEDRGAQIGDVVTVDLKVIDRETGEEIADACEDNLQLDMTETGFIPDLIQNMVGMEVEQTKEISSIFPEGYFPEEYVGKPVTFVVTLKDLKVRELPPLNDEFAQSISEKETLAELREFLEKRITNEAEQKTEANTEKAILAALVEELEVDLPASLIRREVELMVQQQAMYLQRSQLDEKSIKQLFTKELVAEMRRINEPEAIARINRTLALAEIAKLESITASKSEIDARAAEIGKALEGEAIDPAKLSQVVEDEVITEKVLEWLTQNSTIEFVPEGSLEPSTPDEDAGEEPAAITATSETASETSLEEPAATSASSGAVEASVASSDNDGETSPEEPQPVAASPKDEKPKKTKKSTSKK